MKPRRQGLDGAEVATHAGFKAQRLAEVDDGAAGILHKIDTRRIRELGKDVAPDFVEAGGGGAALLVRSVLKSQQVAERGDVVLVPRRVEAAEGRQRVV